MFGRWDGADRNTVGIVYLSSQLQANHLDKRSFIKNLTFGAIGLSVGRTEMPDIMVEKNHIDSSASVTDEEFWKQVRKGYRIKGDYINLENGYYNFLPEQTLEKYIAHIREVNYQGSHYMRTVQVEDKKKAAKSQSAPLCQKTFAPTN